MPLFRSARPQLIAEINKVNGIVLKLSDVVFQPAQAVADIVPPPATTKNTRSIMMASPAAPFTGQVPIYYDRLSLTKVFEHTPVNTYAKLRSFRPTRIHDLIPDLNNYYGLELTTADIEDGDLELVDGVGVAVIKALPTSMDWTGEFTVSIQPGDLNLEKHMTVTDLNGVQYPSGQSVKGQAEVYSYYFDCSAYADYLDAILVTNPEGEPVNAAFVDFVSDATGDDWLLDQPGNFSLEGAKIVFNGANSLNKPSNANYDFICEVVLSDSCANFAGTLRLHYNKDMSIDSVAVVQSLSVTMGVMDGYDASNSSEAGYIATPRYNPYLATAYNDYTPSAGALKNIPWQSTWTNASVANATAIANALKAVDGLPWAVNTSSPTLEYNLYSVYVMYNGPVANAPRTVGGETVEYRDGFTNVMFICPPWQQQSNLWYGIGVVYYNV